MNSSIISLAELLNSATEMVSVGFSSGYSFDEIKAEKYFDELLMNSSPTPIFSGILILEKSDNTYTIIDGLQRITTICLLLCALCENYKGVSKKNDVARNKLLERFLVSPNDSSQPRLQIKGKEQEVYKKILFSQDIKSEDKNTALFQTYSTFLKRIKKQKILGTDLFRLISKIQFMIVLTDKSEISARELYQSLNENKGNSQINLISDFIIQQDATTDKKWQAITAQFKKLSELESFVRDFLITRLDEDIPNKNALYNNFKNYFFKISKFQTLKDILDNMYKYSQYYLRIINSEFTHEEIKEQFIILNENEAKDTYPYLMEVLDDLENGHINTGAFLNILMMINLFIKSQQESSFSNVNINFSKLSKELNKMLVLKDYVPESIEEDKLTINVINKLANFEV